MSLDPFINSVINFVYTYLFWFQFVALFISAIMLWFIVYMNLKIGLTKEKVEHWVDVWNWEKFSERKTLKAWTQIKKRMVIGDETQLKLAVLESDKLLDEIFKICSYPGNSLDERFKKINSSQLANIEEVRQVHKIRDRIASEPDFTITPGEAEIAIAIYKKAFIDLGLIQEED